MPLSTAEDKELRRLRLLWTLMGLDEQISRPRNNKDPVRAWIGGRGVHDAHKTPLVFIRQLKQEMSL